MQNINSIAGDYPSWNIPTVIDNLDKIAGKVFTCSFVISKIRDLPLGPISMALSVVTLALYGTAYTIQIFTSSYYQDVKPAPEWEWSYREYYMMVALIGASVCWLSLGLPASWMLLMLIGTANTFLWYLGEIHRSSNPTAYPKMATQPELYMEYVKWIAISSFISSSAIIVALSIPSHFMLIYMMGLMGNYIASALAIHYLLESFETPDLTSKNLVAN